MAKTKAELTKELKKLKVEIPKEIDGKEPTNADLEEMIEKNQPSDGDKGELKESKESKEEDKKDEKETTKEETTEEEEEETAEDPDESVDSKPDPKAKYRVVRRNIEAPFIVMGVKEIKKEQSAKGSVLVVITGEMGHAEARNIAWRQDKKRDANQRTKRIKIDPNTGKPAKRQ